MRVTREKASFGALAVLLAGALLPAAAQAQGLHNGGCTDPTPCGVVPHPRFVSVYWGSFADVYNPNTTSAPTTSDRIDAFVGALVNSRYFDDAAQYGVHPAQMLPSIFVTPGVCPGVNIPQTVGDDESDGLEAHGLADALVGCLLAHYPFLDNDRTVFNLILAPGVQPIDGSCTSKGAGAEHWRYRGIPTTFIPTNSQCSASSWNSLGQILTHEMIESVTDANPWWGWTENWAGPYIGEEAGDLCNGGTPSIPQGPATFPFMGALLGSDVGAYWNEAVHGCSAGFGSGAPALSEHHVVGTGKNMRFHLEGQFEGPPC